MRRKVLWIMAAVVVLGSIAGAWLVPAIDRESMKIPVVNAISGVRAGNIPFIRAQFTARGAVQAGALTLPIDTALQRAGPLLQSGALHGSMRFDEFRNLRFRTKTEAEADFYVIIDIEGNEEIPYHRVPLRRGGHVVLQREALFTWKIARLGSDDAEFTGALQ